MPLERMSVFEGVDPTPTLILMEIRVNQKITETGIPFISKLSFNIEAFWIK